MERRRSTRNNKKVSPDTPPFTYPTNLIDPHLLRYVLKSTKLTKVDLLAPNLNRDKVKYMAQMEREAAKNSAQAVKNRDKAALEKQRADQAKAKADKQKKAQKQERRG